MTHTMLIGNAPVSWGIYGSAGPQPYTYSRVMDEIAQAGYMGTELGPYGYYPTEAAALRRELEFRSLRLGSSFVVVELLADARYEADCLQALRVGRLLHEFGGEHVVLSASETDERRKRAGSLPPDGSAGWNVDERRTAGQRLNALGRRLQDGLGMSIVFHHHTGTWVEAPWEVDRLLEATDPELVGLCLDTGHLVYGGSDPVATIQRWGDRVRYVHFKDVWPDKLARVREEQLDVTTAWKMGVFSELGQGCVDFKGVVAALRGIGYQGWIIVEQDIVVSEHYRSEHTPLESARLSRDYLRQVMGM